MNRMLAGVSLGAVLVFFGLLATSPQVEAAPGGNSAAAKLCQSDWQTLRTSAGASFKNVGQCVSYAAKGGEFAPADPYAGPRGFCTDLGGTLGIEQRSGVTAWLCTLPGALPSEDEVNYDVFCVGTITTETRGGQVVLVCTP